MDQPAPGRPGIKSTWTSSAKTGVGTAIGDTSSVSFTISHGILNEVYYPRIDEACTRDFGLIVTDGQGYFSEEKRNTDSVVTQLSDGVPGYRVVNQSRDGRYRIEKRIVADPVRDVVLQHVRFEALGTAESPLRLFGLLAPHLVNAGAHNTAWIEDIKGWTLPLATGRGSTLALAASRPFKALSVGFVGASDGFGTLQQNGSLTERYTIAEDGTVAITVELDMDGSDEIVLALGFGRNKFEAGNRARGSIMAGFDEAERAYIADWTSWQKTLINLDPSEPDIPIKHYRVSTAVLRTHEARVYGGGMIASLSIPWGASKGDDDLGGYHLVWPRDLVESALGLLAIGATGEVRRALNYLRVTQEADGHWPQNMWLDGQSYWPGIQLDETAFPVLLVDQAFWEGAISRDELAQYWRMVRHAVQFVLLKGPATGQDRWEEDAGFSPFTLAVEVASLVVAADIATTLGYDEDAAYLLETADLWNASIESWCYASGTALARDAGVDGYYVRISPETSGACSPLNGVIAIKNREGGDIWVSASDVISVDALALVRFGLRSATDPRILNTVAVIDRNLKVELPQGPLWHRYNEDGYGEKRDGSPFDGTGIGRAWPLLAAERAHYEIARGDFAEARRLLATIEASTSQGGLIPEQIWDEDDIPGHELFRGHPSGSAMPLVWAHSEHVKLLRSLRDGKVFDTPPQVVRRYQHGNVTSDLRIWRFTLRASELPAGRRLRIETGAPARLRWSADNWITMQDLDSRQTSFGLSVLDLPTAAMPEGTTISFTFYWPDVDRWEGTNFAVKVVAP